MTECTLKFLGAAVAEVVRDVFIRQRERFVNARARTAETAYSSVELMEVAKRVVGAPEGS